MKLYKCMGKGDGTWASLYCFNCLHLKMPLNLWGDHQTYCMLVINDTDNDFDIQR